VIFRIETKLAYAVLNPTRVLLYLTNSQTLGTNFGSGMQQVDIEVTNENVAMIAWFSLFCYPYGTFYLMIKYFFIQKIWFAKTDFRLCLIYQSNSLANILLLRSKTKSFVWIYQCAPLLLFQRQSSQLN